MSDLFDEPIHPKISVGRRLGTMLLDHVIICFVCLPPIILFKQIVYPDYRYQEILKYLNFPVFVIYFCKDCIHGRSFAKRNLNFCLLSYSMNSEATPIQSVIRNLFIIIWPIEVVFALFNQERRIGDFVAGTKLGYYNPNSPIRKIKFWEIAVSVLLASLFTALLFIVL